MPRPRKSPPAPKRRRRGTGSVGRRADGRVFCTLPTDLDPQRRPIYSPGNRQAFASVDQAAAWLDAEVERRRHPAPNQAAADESLQVYLRRWYLSHEPFWPARTARAYRGALTLWVRAGELGRHPIGQLTHEVIRGALATLRTAKTATGGSYSHRTLSQARTVLSLALGDLVPDVLASNPVARVRLPKAQTPEQPVWDGAEAEAFLAAAETVVPHLALAYRLILRRGLRRGEVLALRWSDIDERRRVLVVDETAGQRAGETGDTKGRRRREIPLSADLLDRLREKRRNGAQSISGVLPVWVFANPETGRPWNLEILGQWAPVVARAAGVPAIAPKDMRATFATVALDEGMPLPRISQILGHSSIAVTSRFYARILQRRNERLQEIAEELDRALDSAAHTAREGAPTPLERPTASHVGS